MAVPAVQAITFSQIPCTADEVDIDTLAERLEATTVDLGATALYSTWIGAWARKE